MYNIQSDKITAFSFVLLNIEPFQILIQLNKKTPIVNKITIAILAKNNLLEKKGGRCLEIVMPPVCITRPPIDWPIIT